jgi:ankyrin repeat protein
MEGALLTLCRVIAAGDAAQAAQILRQSPALARERLPGGATRANPRDYFLDDIMHYVYAGDVALHVAAAAYDAATARRLLTLGADVNARNRRGGTPLHYAADGGPGAPTWNPRAQATMIARLVAAGAEVDAPDNGGTTPLQRAVRNRCASAVRALLAAGADATLDNGRGSTARTLATLTTGRGGAGTPAAKAQQRAIERLLADK